MRSVIDRLRRWLASHIEFTVGTKRGYGALCDICRTDAHNEGQRCPRAMVGLCVDCERTETLDYFGNCSRCGSHSVMYRRGYWSRVAVQPFPVQARSPRPAPTHQPAAVRSRGVR